MAGNPHKLPERTVAQIKLLPALFIHLLLHRQFYKEKDIDKRLCRAVIDVLFFLIHLQSCIPTVLVHRLLPIAFTY